MSLLCFDLETAPNWELIHANEEAADAFCTKRNIEADKLGLYPQWGKIVGVAWGYSREEIQSAVGPDELEILGTGPGGFVSELQKMPTLLGHYIKNFDIPFLAWRLLAHKTPLPEGLRLAGKKPWEIAHIDTYDLLKFGGHNSASLNDACVAFGLPSPKGDVDGSMIDKLVQQGNWGKIRSYVLGDVRSEMELYRHICALGGG